ncbi:hypothetical protein COLO4_12313 [Corchorus olitorius]|uniref:Uncharacterized protein n=1 Tax=Corchorus olitorius TaxID=93759 RepID=A0A1R3K188_9ROSI|nr:hypothetical protein COLO4_12313 [Corchorus olitorius]
MALGKEEKQPEYYNKTQQVRANQMVESLKS